MKTKYSAAILGFLSIYIVWAIPALILGWNEWFSYAYTYGDHLVLPLFNALAFWLIAHVRRVKGKIPLKTVLLSLLVIFPAVFLIAFFEPDASYARETLVIHSGLRIYHSVFVVLEFSFVLFMCLIYPFLRKSYAPVIPVGFLFLLIAVFLALVFWPDDHLRPFPLWEKLTPIGLLALAYLAFLLRKL